jgi:Ufm1-specific protease 1
MPAPVGATGIFQVDGDYKYFHYLCDNFNDVGWGCGFRVLQTLSSWIDPECAPLSVEGMIALLDEIGEQETKDGSWNPTRSKNPWIGTYEGFLILDRAYEVNFYLHFYLFFHLFHQ